MSEARHRFVYTPSKEPRRERSLAVRTVVVFVVGLTCAYLVGWLLPALEVVAFGIAFLLVVGTAGVLHAVVAGRWVFWLVLATTALTAIGTLMLAADLALLASGQRTEVVVVQHEVQVSHGNGTSYTHRYVLEHTDGRPLDQEMTYRGKSGYDGAAEGATITVLVDPTGKAPVRPVSAADPAADTAVLVVGLLGTTAAFSACLVSAQREVTRAG